MNTLLVSDFAVVRGVFVARAFHNDGSSHKMVFHEDKDTVVSVMGPFVKAVTEYSIDDNKFVDVYGQNVKDALMSYKERERA